MRIEHSTQALGSRSPGRRGRIHTQQPSHRACLVNKDTRRSRRSPLAHHALVRESYAFARHCIAVMLLRVVGIRAYQRSR